MRPVPATGAWPSASARRGAVRPVVPAVARLTRRAPAPSLRQEHRRASLGSRHRAAASPRPRRPRASWGGPRQGKTSTDPWRPPGRVGPRRPRTSLVDRRPRTSPGDWCSRASLGSRCRAVASQAPGSRRASSDGRRRSRTSPARRPALPGRRRGNRAGALESWSVPPSAWPGGRCVAPLVRPALLGRAQRHPDCHQRRPSLRPPVLCDQRGLQRPKGRTGPGHWPRAGRAPA